jgi:DNA-binding HxlR family transcriptional regulator
MRAQAGRIQYRCPVSGFQKLANGKHKLRILWALRKGPLHYGELKRQSSMFSEFPMATRVFSRELQLLQSSGLLAKRAVAGRVRRVEYRLSALGETMKPLLESICNWSLTNLDILPPDPGECIEP